MKILRVFWFDADRNSVGLLYEALGSFASGRSHLVKRVDKLSFDTVWKQSAHAAETRNTMRDRLKSMAEVVIENGIAVEHEEKRPCAHDLLTACRAAIELIEFGTDIDDSQRTTIVMAILKRAVAYAE